MAAHPGVDGRDGVRRATRPRIPDPMRMWDVQSGLRAGRRRDGGAAARRRRRARACSTRRRCTSTSSSTPTTPATGRSRPTCSPTVLAPALAALGPTLVLAPFGLANPDHDVTHRALHARARAISATTCRGGATRTSATSTSPACSRGACRRCSAAGSGRRRCARRPTPTRRASRRRSRATRRSCSRSRTTGQIGAKLAAPAPEQFWRLAPPPPGWERPRSTPDYGRPGAGDVDLDRLDAAAALPAASSGTWLGAVQM